MMAATIATLDSDALVFDTQTRVYLNSGISEYAVIIAIRGFKFEVQESNPEGCQRVAGGHPELSDLLQPLPEKQERSNLLHRGHVGSSKKLN